MKGDGKSILRVVKFKIMGYIFIISIVQGRGAVHRSSYYLFIMITAQGRGAVQIIVLFLIIYNGFLIIYLLLVLYAAQGRGAVQFIFSHIFIIIPAQGRRAVQCISSATRIQKRRNILYKWSIVGKKNDENLSAQMFKKQ